MGLDLSAVGNDIDQFSLEREWYQFHTLRNLSLAIIGEVGELVEIIQWLSDDQVADLLQTNDGRRRIEEEVADIAIYLVRIAQVTDIDLEQVIRNKLRMNAIRYPIQKFRGSADKYSKE